MVRPDPAGKGWELRFTVERSRVDEYRELYEGLKLEVMILTIDIHGDLCTICFEDDPEKMVEVWTRDPQAAKTGGLPMVRF